MTDIPAENALAPQVVWVNHASFAVSLGGANLICDPWLSGSAFKNGWRHVAPTALTPDGFDAFTHVWISHQHPDHFAPLDLRRIPAGVRERLAVLYQSTPDKLVVSWLRGAGFRDVRELPMDRWFALTPELDVMCGALNDDSWLALRTAWGTLLNVNDCVLKRRTDIERIKNLVGPVDVLFTQFSYAQWTGNPEDVEQRRADAAEKFDRIRLQTAIFDPKTVVPFASFVYFSNEENFFLNDCMNRVGDVAEFIERELGRNAVVLYPGESWNAAQTRDWRPAAARYASDVAARLSAGPVDVPGAVAIDDFEKNVRGFLARLRKKNPMARAVVRDKTTIFLTDHLRSYELSADALVPAGVDARHADIATASENVLYAFRTPWGGNTLHVSGRFRSYLPNGHLRFFKMMRQLHHYNRTPVDAEWLFEQCRRIVRGARNRVARLTQRRTGPPVSRA